MEPNWPEKRQSSFLYPLWDSAFERTGPSWNVVSICFNSSCNTSERLRTPQLSEALWLIVSQISQLGGAAMLRLLLASLFSCIAADEPGLELSAWLKFKKTKRSCCLLQNVASIACKTLKTFIYFHDILLNPHLISLYILYQPSFPSCWTVVSALRTASFCRPATVQRAWRSPWSSSKERNLRCWATNPCCRRSRRPPAIDSGWESHSTCWTSRRSISRGRWRRCCREWARPKRIQKGWRCLKSEVVGLWSVFCSNVFFCWSSSSTKLQNCHSNSLSMSQYCSGSKLITQLIILPSHFVIFGCHLWSSMAFCGWSRRAWRQIALCWWAIAWVPCAASCIWPTCRSGSLMPWCWRAAPSWGTIETPVTWRWFGTP